MTSNLTTDFRRLDRLQFRKDLVPNPEADALHDRMTEIRGRTGKYTPDELGIPSRIWRKMSSEAKYREIANYNAGLKIRAMSQSEFSREVVSAREFLGI